MGAPISSSDPKMFGLPVRENTLVRTPISVWLTQEEGMGTATIYW